jgi:hypothetical protein
VQRFAAGRSTTAGVVVALLWALAACVPGAPNAGPDGGRQLPVGAKRSFDLYLADKAALLGRSMRGMRNRCLAEAGYPQNLRVSAIQSSDSGDEPALDSVSPRMFGPTSDEEARRKGFGRDAPVEPGQVVSFDPNYDRSLETCQQEAWATIGQEAKDVSVGYLDLRNKLSGEFTNKYGELVRQRMDGLLRKQLACIERGGKGPIRREEFLRGVELKEIGRVFGVPLGRLEGSDPTWAPARIQGTIQVGPPTPARRYVPTSQEADLAVVWFRCSREVVDVLLPIAEQVEREVVDRHEAEFAELNPKLEQLARRAAELAGR